MVSSKEELNYVSFNQDQSCFICATNNGFTIYSAFPFEEISSRDLGGSLGIAEMFYCTNLLALVGGGSNPKFPPNKVVLWDDKQTKVVAELIFLSEVRTIKLRKSKLLVAIDNKIFLYQLHDLKILDIIDTCYNPLGLCCFSLDEDIMSCPDSTVGHIIVNNYTKKTSKTRKAHNSIIRKVEISDSGAYLATASEKGTIIRIFDVNSLTIMKELRHGTDYQHIVSIAFNVNDSWIAVMSHTGRLSIFNTTELPKEVRAENEKKGKDKDKKSNNSSFKIPVPGFLTSFFNPQASYQKLELKDKGAKLSFGAGADQLFIISLDGNYYHVNPQMKKPGENQIKEKKTFFKSNSNP